MGGVWGMKPHERKKMNRKIQERVDHEVNLFLRAWLEWFREEFGQDLHTEVLVAMNRRGPQAHDVSPAGGQDGPCPHDARSAGDYDKMLREIEPERMAKAAL